MTAVRSSIRSAPDAALQWCLETPLPAEIAVGAGSAAPIVGWCFHREAEITELRLVSGPREEAALAHSLPRPDVSDALPDEPQQAYSSGFYGVLPLAGVSEPASREVTLKAILDDGRIESTITDELTVSPSLGVGPLEAMRGCRIAVCMATHNPPYELFARQVESISRQSYTEWRCLISDDRSNPEVFDRMLALVGSDRRFVIDRHASARGAYHNFERALALIGSDVDFVALADQDDLWYPEKLEILAGVLGKHLGSILAYSDARVVDRDRSPLAESYFGKRRNNTRDLRKMVMANTVTGASAMFRRELLDSALPFPPSASSAAWFHDHWLALVALACGELSYIDRPLYEYVQHAGNLLGHAARAEARQRGSYRGPWMLRSRGAYQYQLMRAVTLAWALRERLDGRLSPEHTRELVNITAVEQSEKALVRLALHAVGARRSSSSTLGAERDVLEALAWRRWMSRAAKRRDRVTHPWFTAAVEPRPRPVVPADELPSVRRMLASTAPLSLEIDGAQPARVNLLLGGGEPGDDARAVGLLARLETAETRTRVVIVDRRPADDWAVDVLDASDRGTTRVPVSPRDVFLVATSGTAALAHCAARELGHERFVYLISDDEALKLPAGAQQTQAKRSLELPHYAVFASELIRDHFRGRRRGVFASGDALGLELSAVVNCPISRVSPPSAAELRRRSGPRLAFWAEPARTGADGMFELGLLALRRAVELGLLADCELSLIGPRLPQSAVEVAPDVPLVLEGPYGASRPEGLRRYDVGLALAGTPQPNPLSLEMAASGMVAVVNTCGVRTEDWVRARSPNLLAAEPTIDALASALGRAVERAADVETRVSGAGVDWPTDWSEALTADALERVERLVRACRAPGRGPVAAAVGGTGKAPSA